MEKIIKIGKQDVRFSNNLSWAMIYRDQFGHDIIPTLTPMLAAFLDVVSGIASEVGLNGKADLEELLKIMDGDKLLDAVIHLSGLEFVELLNIAWAMAKAADDDIPEPKTWIRGFDTFPVDKVAPELFSMAFKGMVSSKNLKRLNELTKQIKVLQPLNSIQSSSLDSSEG